jgi:hypothetical protein
MPLTQTPRIQYRSRVALLGEPRLCRGEPAGLRLELIRGEARIEATLRIVRDGSQGEQVR